MSSDSWTWLRNFLCDFNVIALIIKTIKADSVFQPCLGKCVCKCCPCLWQVGHILWRASLGWSYYICCTDWTFLLLVVNVHVCLATVRKTYKRSSVLRCQVIFISGWFNETCVSIPSCTDSVLGGWNWEEKLLCFKNLHTHVVATVTLTEEDWKHPSQESCVKPSKRLCFCQKSAGTIIFINSQYQRPHEVGKTEVDGTYYCIAGGMEWAGLDRQPKRSTATAFETDTWFSCQFRSLK